MTVRVLLADDHAAIRSGVRLMLGAQPDLEIVGEAADGATDGATAVSQADVLRPDVVLIDVRMPGLDGIEATALITGRGLAQVLVLTAFDLDDHVEGALRAGTAGFLLKSADADVIADAVRRVAAGEGVLAPEVTRAVLERFSRLTGPVGAGGTEDEARRAGALVERLTARERDVLDCLSDGLSNAGIAERPVISEPTAKTHVSRVLAKLDCTSRVQAALLTQRPARPAVPRASAGIRPGGGDR